MSAAGAAARQAMILTVLAQHMATHHLALLSVGDLTTTAQLRVLDSPGAITAWARSVPADQVAVMVIPGQGWSAVEFSTELAGHTVRVWGRVEGLPPGVTSLSVDELGCFAGYSTLPPGGGS